MKMEMDITDEKINDQVISTKRRSSILKIPKNKNDPVEPYEDMTVSKSTRRVSFASSNFIKPFVADPDKNTIWDTTYEEEINHTDSTQSSQEHQWTTCSKFESTVFNSVKNYSTSSMDITKGAIFEDKENVPVAPRKISIIDYAKKITRNPIDSPYQRPLQKDVMESFSGCVTQLYPQTMEFTCINADTKKVQIDSCHDILKPTTADMELTCIPLTVKFGQSYCQTEVAADEDFSPSDMELTCQVPKSGEDLAASIHTSSSEFVKTDFSLANEDKSVSTNLELTCQMSDNDELFEPNTMEFTCQIPQNRTILVKEKITESQRDFISQTSATTKNSVKTSEILVTEKEISTLSRKNMSDNCNDSSRMVETCINKTLEDMDFTCHISKNTLAAETLKNIVNSDKKGNEKETCLKLPLKNSDVNILSNVSLKSEDMVKYESQKDEPVNSENFESAHSSVNSYQSTTEECPMEVTYCNNPSTIDLSTKNLSEDSKILITSRDKETSASSRKISFIQNETSLTTKNSMSPTNSSIKKTDMTDVCKNSEVDELVMKMGKSNLDPSCTPVVNEENILPLRDSTKFSKTPESSFHINVTNINTLLDDTEQLVHCTFTKPALDSFVQFDIKANQAENMNHIGVRNITNQYEVNDPYVHNDDVKNTTQSSSDDSLICLRKSKLAAVNDTYVLKGKSAGGIDSLKTEQDPSEDINKNISLEEDSELNDSSLGCINVDECVDLDKLAIEAKLSPDSEKTNFKKWLDEFKFTEFNIEFKKNTTISEKIKRINKQRAEIKEILENFKFKPIPIPDTLSFIDNFLNNDIQSPQQNHLNQSVELNLEEKIKKHEESSQNSWKLKKIDGNFYTFSTLFGALLFTVEIHPEGRVIDIKTSNNLKEEAERIALYIMKVFLDRLDSHHVKSAVGEYFDIFSLLDYVQMTMLKLLELQEDLVKCRILTLDENFMANFKMLSTVATISSELVIDVNNLENIDYDALKISTRIGRVDENEIKKIIKLKNPKGFTFFKSFAECIEEYITVKEKRCMKKKVY